MHIQAKLDQDGEMNVSRHRIWTGFRSRAFCKTVETGERSLNSSVSDSSTNHCAMSPALCECQCGDYDSGLVHQHKPEGRRLTIAIISTPL